VKQPSRRRPLPLPQHPYFVVLNPSPSFLESDENWFRSAMCDPTTKTGADSSAVWLCELSREDMAYFLRNFKGPNFDKSDCPPPILHLIARNSGPDSEKLHDLGFVMYSDGSQLSNGEVVDPYAAVLRQNVAAGPSPGARRANIPLAAHFPSLRHKWTEFDSLRFQGTFEKEPSSEIAPAVGLRLSGTDGMATSSTANSNLSNLSNLPVPLTFSSIFIGMYTEPFIPIQRRLYDTVTFVDSGAPILQEATEPMMADIAAVSAATICLKHLARSTVPFQVSAVDEELSATSKSSTFTSLSEDICTLQDFYSRKRLGVDAFVSLADPLVRSYNHQSLHELCRNESSSRYRLSGRIDDSYSIQCTIW
jgi:hypothetical protein